MKLSGFYHYYLFIVISKLCFCNNLLTPIIASNLFHTNTTDICDYQQYKTGERIDGMFSAVTTIGTVITLATSSVLPIIYEKNGLTRENAALVTSNPEVLNRVLGDGKTVGQLLSEQLANGQDNYNNALSALYDPAILLSLVKVLIVVAAIGALMNVIPYIWYDFNERKQKSVVRVLKVRAMFEDYGNGVLKDAELVEVIDIIRKAKEMAIASPKTLDKKSYKSIKDKEERKAAKKAYLADKEFNDEIEIGKFVCEELDKFSTPAVQLQVRENEKVYAAGLNALLNADISLINQEIAIAKAMPKSTKEEKEIRKTAIEIVKSKKASYKAVKKYFSKGQDFKQPDFAELDKFFNAEDDCEAKLKTLYLDLKEAKKAKDTSKVTELKAEIKKTDADRKDARKFSKEEMDKHAYFNRAAKVYLDAEKLIKQKENYSHFEEIEKMYDDAKSKIEA